MAEQLGIVGRDDQARPAVHRAGQPFHLFLAIEHEVAGMLGSLVQGSLRIVGLLLVGPAGNLEILDAQVAADAGLVQVGAQVFVIQIEADVAVKLAVLVIAGIAFDGAPDLLGGLGVAGQDGDAALGTNEGSVDAELGTRLGKQDPVRVREKVADARIAQQLVDSRRVAALGQPDALRPFAEVPLELAATDLDLGMDRVPVDGHEREEAVRRSAGDDFELAGLEETAETVDDVVAVLIDEHLACPQEAAVVHVGQVIELRLPAGALNLLAGQGDEVVDVADIAVLQKRVGQHGGQGWGDGHGQAPVGAVALQAVESFQKRNVRLGNGFVEPVFFEKIVVFGMADKGQMGVQDQAQVTERHRQLPGKSAGGECPDLGQSHAAWMFV